MINDHFLQRYPRLQPAQPGYPSPRPFAVTRSPDRVSDDPPQRNKALVIKAMTSLFQRHDASAVEFLYATDYIQHNPNILQGREALKALVAALSKDVYYEPGLMVAEGARNLLPSIANS
ncbi:nuclear transport factor 2 family protein [Neorhizobium galegae]|uniref:Uncharacterized protein n=2 Tax=Neorhizobium galegae TaxID=399 RepID=A0A068SZJ9_NEOGA|nr:nuclear transport factor 2 family protein [Neorhizobium galegae]MCQ1855043.1 nuclear transport factor 2 family protein [Neorhizobium galegae]CDN50610.1 Hypothetical protein RG540_CH44690 [Neorhizobium galegae bv. orientalis str. HAMBI 540]CDZ48531.1 Hypothetical protein NGAL_HAMBI2427_26890 [Neorhizobium galegae bv. orientalis]